jgi:hypothetical protein
MKQYLFNATAKHHRHDVSVRDHVSARSLPEAVEIIRRRLCILHDTWTVCLWICDRLGHPTRQLSTREITCPDSLRHPTSDVPFPNDDSDDQAARKAAGHGGDCGGRT